jgi:glycosyltransferase involved in cell wall biosynthesis
VARPRLLFLSHVLPYPPDTGAKSRTFHTLRALSEGFEVTALCYYRRATLTGGGMEAAIAALSPYAEVQAFPIPEEESAARRAWNHTRSMVTGHVYTRFALSSPAFAAALDQALARQRWALVHLDSLDLSAVLDRLENQRVVCVHHDVQSRQLERRSLVEASAPRRAYLTHQARLMRKEEQRCCPRFALNVMVSEFDAATLRSLAPASPILVVPNGVDLEYFAGENPDGDGIVFVGGADWGPNRDAMEFMGTAILPALRRRLPRVPVRWVGRIDEASARRFRDRFGIEPTGRLDDVRPLLAGAGCVVVPLRAGSGTRVKILDAWAMQKAVVSTTLGAEGLDARDGENILLRDDPEAFASAVHAVLTDHLLRRRIAVAGQETARQQHDWRALGAMLTQRYRNLADTPHPAMEPRQPQ